MSLPGGKRETSSGVVRKKEGKPEIARRGRCQVKE